MDNELLLFDRLEVIRKTIEKYGEDNFYLSYSGGKDSTVVHHLLDIAIPNNNIPRVFCNTGIEYNDVFKFVEQLSKIDKRIVIIQPKNNVKATLNKVGYPFKSKVHSTKIGLYQRGSRSKSVMIYKNRQNISDKYNCPVNLLYQYDDDFNLNISELCCMELKKKPFKEYQKQNNKPITITGMMKEEGGQRENINCIVTRDGKVVKFHPLAKVSREWEEWFIEEYDIDLCELYYEPYNFKRTGCKGCPFALSLQEDLTTMQLYLPSERKQCEYIWKPVYEEYRRIGYRLSNEEQIKLF